MKEKFQQAVYYILRLGSFPLSFLGIGLYRAWLATFFRYDVFPTITFNDYAIFEWAIGLTALCVFFLAKRIAPLTSRISVYIFTFFSLTLGSLFIIVGCFGEALYYLKFAGLVISGIGLGLLILMWTEFLGCLTPRRVAIHYSAAILLGEFLKWLFTGLLTLHIIFFSLTLPAASLLSLLFAFTHISQKRLPQTMLRDSNTPKTQNNIFLKKNFFKFDSLPWKIILLMIVCTFATGFAGLPDQPILAGNTFGSSLAALIVLTGTLSSSKWFNFDVIYQFAVPILGLSLILIAPYFSAHSNIVVACYDAGYTMLTVLVAIVLSNLTYRYGIAAAWLNGIERGLRYVAEASGWGFFVFISKNLATPVQNTLHVIIIVTIITIFIWLWISERKLSANWGINLNEHNIDYDVVSKGPKNDSPSIAVGILSSQYDLTPREEEVLQLMSQKLSNKEMKQELFVSEGTIKSHTSHIYKKLGISGREELNKLLGLDDN